MVESMCFQVASLLLFIFIGICSGLVVEVKVPQYVTRGSDARLQCKYALEGATLYSLKWYKGDSQFYQFIPANKQPKTTFRVPGVQIDFLQSSSGEVQLRDMRLASSGAYRCEVITEAPKFITKFGEGNMTVIVLPDTAPLIDGARTSYHMEEQVVVNCTSPASKPAALLQWFINDRRVDAPSMLHHFPPFQDNDGLQASVLGLTFRTNRSHFPGGQMRLKCVAAIASLYLQSQETSVIETSFLHRLQAEESRGYNFFSRGVTKSVEKRLPLALVIIALCITTALN